ncbi:MAG: Gfo/Idh/MocA family oxidoreductase [Ruminococcaceae bacterium]|nr:Gfo/Idh/MocA family oxidoreductase [Oscillospiraceae bacterium]
MNKKIKIGVFGAHRGSTMIQFCLNYEDTELVALCDKYEPVLAEWNKKIEDLRKEREDLPEVALYTSFDEFIQHEEMDAVVLANYAHEHAPYAIRCLNAGKHVISEVLPAHTLAQAVELVEAVERSGKVYAYAENYCYFQLTSEMRRLYRAGELGEFEYGEGEYIHSCTHNWHNLTYGDRNHWRNTMYSTFYCTHSLGPLVHITGLRPVRVNGFERVVPQRCLEVGKLNVGGLEMVEFENGATVKSIHGQLLREPSSVWYALYGSKGMMEGDRWDAAHKTIYVYREADRKYEKYDAAPVLQNDITSKISGHGGSDCYTMYYFIRKIQGMPEGKESIDVYEAMDMYLPGLIAYKSILNGGITMEVPNLRLKSERDRYRFDTFGTDPAICGSMLAPSYHLGTPEIPDEVYEKVRRTWEETGAK